VTSPRRARDHEPNINDPRNAVGAVPTGREFVTNDEGEHIAPKVPTWDDAIWTEFRAADGSFFYVSDHEDYTLAADEFDPTGVIIGHEALNA
jgi:hypothetical protein